MSDKFPPSRLFVTILQTLEAIDAPYVIIGAFAATAYGITRTTISVNLRPDRFPNDAILVESIYKKPVRSALKFTLMPAQRMILTSL